MATGFSSRLQKTCCIIALACFLLPGCAFPVQGEAHDAADLIDVSQNVDVAQRGLSNFYSSLERLQNGQISQLNILQIGDSHTANNFFSGRLRSRFQAQFGNAGRGMMPPGVVYPGINQQDVKPSMDAGWSVDNSLRSSPAGPYGLSGFLVRSTRSGAHINLTAMDTGFDWIAVDYLTRSHGGKFEVLLDGKSVGTISTAGPNGYVKQFSMWISNTHQMTIVALDKGITLTAMGSLRRNHGIVYTSSGVVGATASLYQHWNLDVLHAEVQALKPSLIVIAYGTNEAFETNFDSAAYAKAYMTLISILRQAAPNASFLMVGPPDSQKAEAHCSRGIFSSCDWQIPPALESVRATQRQIAASEGIDYWDWSKLMPHGIASWIEHDLARSDHVHMTPAGYEASADVLFDQLMKGYSVYKAGLSHHP